MKSLWTMALAGVVTMGFAQKAMTPEGCAARLTKQVDSLLVKDQPKLFAWHLRSLRALVQSELAKLAVDVPQRGHSAEARAKEFVEFVTTISDGLERDAANPDDALKNGRRNLILARLSDIDGSLQYMMVDLPNNWDPNRAYPLFVGLHGTGPDYPLAYPSYSFGPIGTAPTGATSDMIRLAPWGRGNRGWRGDAERDLFEAIALLKTFAKLDPERWYLTGHSAGADGTWAIALHTPDLWAAIGLQSGSMLAGRPEWGLVPNLSNMPTHILIGANDNLPSRIPDSKEAYRLQKAAGADAELVILPNIGHYPLTPEALEEQAVWMTRHVRKRPDRFSFTVDDPAHTAVWGVRVVFSRGERFIKEPWPHFEVDVKGHEVRVKTEHVKSLQIDLGPNGLRLTGDVKLIVDGMTVHDGPVPASPITVPLG